ncbi:MAG: tRNA preQ1(34) S-adenosylmethionine ribosyltransferase-isomerase QueA [Lacunisphaera sp.]|nr:tRNA preQ1(34) S-adenosylmethionine ribosyltransferase-isomerase QueA [Lacunisphaera sp.]
MQTDLFDYPLPERLIAQQPADRRDASRLLVVDRHAHTVAHRHFRDLPEFLCAGDRLFRNNAAVIPARLHATRPTGGHVECLLLRPAATDWSAGDPAREIPEHAQVSGLSASVSRSENRGQTPGGQQPATARSQVSADWWCLLRPGKKLPVGAQFGVTGLFTGTVREKTGEGLVRVAFDTPEGDILAVAQRIGEMPLPPYIAGRHSDAERRLDRERYQTVYADRGHQVAAAAPTAGLHFTPELLEKLAGQGVGFADLTLHVGLGTFRPIMTERIEDHAIHREVYEIPAATQQALFNTTGRRIAVGTTSVRSIEDFLSRHPAPAAGDFLGEAGLFIHPPRDFRGVDALITNFHQPRSTLLCLVAAFLAPGSTDGIAWLREIYGEAVAREYRFFSYGDAMLIL